MDAKIYRAFIWFCFSFFYWGNIYSSGPLLQKDQYYTKFSLLNHKTDHVFDNQGVVRNNCNHFRQTKYILESDIGLSDRDTLSQKFGFVRVKEELDGTTEGFTDYQIVLKHAFIKKTNQILSLETLFNLPLKGYKPAVRYGNFGMGLMLFYGTRQSILSYPFLFSFGAGGVHYSHVADFLKLYSRLTVCPTSLCSLRATFRLDYGLNNGKHIINRSLVDLNPNARVLRGDFEVLIRPMSCVELTFGYFNNFWGRNVGSGGGFMGSFVYCF